jgi:7-keto-8-aminopelargonate synthetase-like enzyme
VPMGTARIRTQVSAAHAEDDLRFAAATLSRVAGETAA